MLSFHLLVLVLCFSVSNARTCYECYDRTDCQQPSTIICPSDAYGCATAILDIEPYITKGCLSDDKGPFKLNGCKRKTKSGVTGQLCGCMGRDLCNTDCFNNDTSCIEETAKMNAANAPPKENTEEPITTPASNEGASTPSSGTPPANLDLVVTLGPFTMPTLTPVEDHTNQGKEATAPGHEKEETTTPRHESTTPEHKNEESTTLEHKNEEGTTPGHEGTTPEHKNDESTTPHFEPTTPHELSSTPVNGVPSLPTLPTILTSGPTPPTVSGSSSPSSPTVSGSTAPSLSTVSGSTPPSPAPDVSGSTPSSSPTVSGSTPPPGISGSTLPGASGPPPMAAAPPAANAAASVPPGATMPATTPAAKSNVDNHHEHWQMTMMLITTSWILCIMIMN